MQTSLLCLCGAGLSSSHTAIYQVYTVVDYFGSDSCCFTAAAVDVRCSACGWGRNTLPYVYYCRYYYTILYYYCCGRMLMLFAQ
jgi:hypothetical protein